MLHKKDESSWSVAQMVVGCGALWKCCYWFSLLIPTQQDASNQPVYGKGYKQMSFFVCDILVWHEIVYKHEKLPEICQGNGIEVY